MKKTLFAALLVVAAGAASAATYTIDSHHANARFAIDHFCYWAVRHAGSMIAAMGGLDCIAFTGGIGENDAEVRARIVSGLGFMGAALDQAANAANATRIDAGGPVAALIVPAAEEAFIAAEVRRCLNPHQGT